MKIFILEDNLERIQQFKDKLTNDTVCIAQTVAQAIELAAQNGPFDYMFLDHDLAEEHYDPLRVANCTIPNGNDFAKWLVEHPECVHDYTVIVVHSMNPTGAKNMIQTINSSHLDCIPSHIIFPNLIRSIT